MQILPCENAATLENAATFENAASSKMQLPCEMQTLFENAGPPEGKQRHSPQPVSAVLQARP
jgi:hypothetical protein